MRAVRPVRRRVHEEVHHGKPRGIHGRTVRFRAAFHIFAETTSATRHFVGNSPLGKRGRKISQKSSPVFESIVVTYPSLRKRHRDVAQLGRALRSGRRGRRFKSCHPDHCMVKARCSHRAFFVQLRISVGVLRKRVCFSSKVRRQAAVMLKYAALHITARCPGWDEYLEDT